MKQWVEDAWLKKGHYPGCRCHQGLCQGMEREDWISHWNKQTLIK